jgi:hypothetical protein
MLEITTPPVIAFLAQGKVACFDSGVCDLKNSRFYCNFRNFR